MDSGHAARSKRRRNRKKSSRTTLAKLERLDSAPGTHQVKTTRTVTSVVQQHRVEEREELRSIDGDEWRDRLRAEGEGMISHSEGEEEGDWESEDEEERKEDELALKNKGREVGEVAAMRWKNLVEDEDEEDLRRSEGEGMTYHEVEEDELAPMKGRAKAKNESEADERTKRRSESDREAYERLKREAEDEQKAWKSAEEEEKRLRQEEAEAEEARLRMARDWAELERQREQAQAEEERKSREKVEEVMRAAEEAERRKQREQGDVREMSEAAEKMRREQEIDQLVTRQTLEIQNRRDELLRASKRRMGPVKWVPDEQAVACQSCQEPFTFTKRRHHCRACGHVFCAKCSSKTSRVRWYEDPERVCDPCFLYLKGYLERKVVLMSGSNSGVVADVAEEMARQGAYLAILSPNADEASALAARIQRVTGNTEVMPLWADFDSLDSVNEAVARFRRQFDRLDVLINNCIVEPKDGRAIHAVTLDGNDKMFSLNYLSHFLVTYSLLDLLKLSTPSRVINVCPRPSPHVYVNFDDFQMENRWSDNRTVQQSRLGIYSMTRELGLRLKDCGVVMNVLDLDHVYSSRDSLLRRAWGAIKGDTRNDEAKNAYLYMAASPLTQEVSRGCFLPDGEATLFRGDMLLDDSFCSHFFRATYDLVAKWVGGGGGGAGAGPEGMMEGRMMESTLAERMREATRECEERREREENERLEIGVGAGVGGEEGEEAKKKKKKGKEVLEEDEVEEEEREARRGGVAEGGGVGPIMKKQLHEKGRGRDQLEVYAHHEKGKERDTRATKALATPASLELW